MGEWVGVGALELPVTGLTTVDDHGRAQTRRSTAPHRLCPRSWLPSIAAGAISRMTPNVRMPQGDAPSASYAAKAGETFAATVR